MRGGGTTLHSTAAPACCLRRGPLWIALRPQISLCTRRSTRHLLLSSACPAMRRQKWCPPRSVARVCRSAIVSIEMSPDSLSLLFGSGRRVGRQDTRTNERILARFDAHDAARPPPGCDAGQHQQTVARFAVRRPAPVFDEEDKCLNWRRERDSNPRRAFDPYTLSRGAPSTTRPSLRLRAIKAGLSMSYKLDEPRSPCVASA